MFVRLRRLAIVLCLAAAMPVAGTPMLGVELDRIEAGPVVLEDVTFALLLRDDGGAGLRLLAAKMELPAATVLERVEVRCANGVLEDGRMECLDGTFGAEHPALGTISGRADFTWDRTADVLHVSVAPFAVGSSVIEGEWHRERGEWRGEFAGKNVALAAVHDVLAALNAWPAAYTDPGGRLDVAIRARGVGGTVAQVEGVVRAGAIAFLGPSSAENLSFESTFAVDPGEAWSVRADGSMDGGLLYLEPGFELRGMRPGITLEAGADAIRFGVDVAWHPSDRRLAVARLDLVHPGVVEAHASAELRQEETWAIEQGDLTLVGAAAGPLYATWLQPFLLGTQFGAMELDGAADASVSVRSRALQALDLEIRDLHAYDGNERFSIAGLDGSLHVTPGAEPVASTLAWQGAGVYRLNLGPGELELSSALGAVQVKRWRDVPILDGGLHIESLDVRDAGRPDMTIRLDGELTPISMADFTQALGWPVMSGTLAGRIDGLTWSRGRLEVGGAIDVALFDGNLVVRNLRIDDLFGLVPVLRADIDVRNIDLGQLTDRFSFGRIEGRLGGSIHALELQAWQPVYFEAALATPEDDRTRHRISQRAVDNLGYIGGGASGALSGGFLRFFKEYSYGRLGLSCRLNNGTCELGGVERTADGFLILTRGGLLPPWIEVKGTGRSIGWYDLVEGFKRIANEPPEIK